MLIQEDYFKNIFNTVREGILILDENMRVLSANRSFFNIFKVDTANTIGSLLYDIGNGQWDIPYLRVLLEDILPENNTVDDYEIEHNFESIGHKTMLLNACKIITKENALPIIFLAIEDITERERLEDLLRESEERYRRIFETASDGIVLLEKREGHIIHANPATRKMLGYSEEEYIGKTLHDIGVSIDMSDFQVVMQTLNRCGIINYADVPVRTRSGQYIDTDIYIVDRAILAQCNIRDVTERKLAEKHAESQLRKLSALHSIDLTINSSLDIRMTLKVFIDYVLTHLNVDAANVLLLDRHTRTLEYAASQGFRTSVLRHSHVRLGKGYAGVAALENRIVNIPNLRGEDSIFNRLRTMEGEDFIAYYGVPLVAKGQVKGVLEIFHRSLLEPDEDWFEFLDALVLQAAIAIDNDSLFYELERSNMGLTLAYDSTIEGWARALEYRDKETAGHSQRVTEITVNIARELGMNEEELVHVRRGAILHDIGKMGIPDSILLKQSDLTDEEWKIMRLHPVYSYKILQPITYLRPALDIPYCHHESWDGSGYPRGIRGEEIPLPARIFAVVDAWDALRSDRPYHEAWTEEKTKEYIDSLSGIQFDPKIVKVFFRAIAENNNSISSAKRSFT